MHYKKPQYYDNFTCIADRCPDTCCAGWQIVIDDISLENYGKISGTFGVAFFTFTIKLVFRETVELY